MGVLGEDCEGEAPQLDRARSVNSKYEVCNKHHVPYTLACIGLKRTKQCLCVRGVFASPGCICNFESFYFFLFCP